MYEKDFQPHIRCAYCGELVYVHDAMPVNLTTGKVYTCNEREANELVLDKLREGL